MASMVMPSFFIAVMYFTKYCAYTPKYSSFRLPPTELPLSFIQSGADQGVAIILILGFIASICFNKSISGRSFSKLNFDNVGSVSPAGRSL